MDPPPHLNGGTHSQNCPYTFSQLREKQIFGGALLWWGGLIPSFSGWGGSGNFSCKISSTLRNTFSSYFRYKISKKFCLRRTTLTFQTLHFHKKFRLRRAFYFFIHDIYCPRVGGALTPTIFGGAKTFGGGAKFQWGASNPCPCPA